MEGLTQLPCLLTFSRMIEEKTKKKKKVKKNTIYWKVNLFAINRGYCNFVKNFQMCEIEFSV